MGFTMGTVPCILRAMQDRFVGDIGDFGKYGLLRALTGLWDWERKGPLPEHERLSLGVVWYRNEDPKGGLNAGQIVGYLFDPLNAPLYSDLDPELYTCLKEIVYIRRNVDEIDASKILGENKEEVIYHGEIVPKKRHEREKWFKNALACVTGKDVVLLDPDNGIYLPQKWSVKHVNICEIRPFMTRGQTVVIYHHLGRQKDHFSQIEDWRRNLEQKLGVNPSVLRYQRGTSRAFFILPAARHAELIDKRLGKMLDGPWKQHFTLHRAKG